MIEVRVYSDQTLSLLEEQAIKDGIYYYVLGSSIFVDDPSEDFKDLARDQGVGPWA